MTEPVPAPTPSVGGFVSPGRFHVRQKITPFQNTYRVFADANGEPGALIAFAKQKRIAFKEQFTLFADEAATRPVLGIKADRGIDIRSVMTVTDLTTGQVVGQLRKKGAKSIFRSTWEMEQPGQPVVTVQERNPWIAVLRRLWGELPYVGAVPVPWVFHFDGVVNGHTVIEHSRLWGIRDRYVMDVKYDATDARLAIALAICLDAMQHR